LPYNFVRLHSYYFELRPMEVTKWLPHESSPGEDSLGSRRILPSTTVTHRNGSYLRRQALNLSPITAGNIASRPIPSCSMLSVTGDGCGNNMFRCNDGKCIQLILVCDYRGDCDDNSDEMQSCRKYSSILLLPFNPKITKSFFQHYISQ